MDQDFLRLYQIDYADDNLSNLDVLFKLREYFGVHAQVVVYPTHKEKTILIRFTNKIASRNNEINKIKIDSKLLISPVEFDQQETTIKEFTLSKEDLALISKEPFLNSQSFLLNKCGIDTTSIRGQTTISAINFLIKLLNYTLDILDQKQSNKTESKSMASALVPAALAPKIYELKLNNLTIKAYTDSIVNVTTDAIVNSLRSDLNFKESSKLAAGIYRKYGDLVESETIKRVKKENVKFGDIIITSDFSRTAPFYIINVISPDYPYKPSRNDLIKLFHEVLLRASNLTSVTIPLLFTGGYGLPVEHIAKPLIESIYSYQQNSSLNNTLKEIHLVNIDKSRTDLIINKLEELNNPNYVLANNQASVSNKGNSMSQKQFYKLLEDDSIKKCIICGQKVKTVIQITKCGHNYCFGCMEHIQSDKSCSFCKDNDSQPRSSKINSDDNDVIMIDESENEIKKPDEDLTCEICCDSIKNPKDKIKLSKCGHEMCKNCHDKIFTKNPKCPFCQISYGTSQGDQPKNGKMSHRIIDVKLPGYRNCNTIQINYSIPGGKQEDCHPNPGRHYQGINRDAFLPNNAEGNHILNLLYKAFQNRLVFTIGTSRTTNQDGVITWNDIHHKTSLSSGPFGYPDETYLQRVKEELKLKGIE